MGIYTHTYKMQRKILKEYKLKQLYLPLIGSIRDAFHFNLFVSWNFPNFLETVLQNK